MLLLIWSYRYLSAYEHVAASLSKITSAGHRIADARCWFSIDAYCATACCYVAGMTSLLGAAM
jgi:hypothetical protein